MNYPADQSMYMSNSADSIGAYGSSGFAVGPQKGGFVRGMRQRMNLVAILVSLFLPWLLFCLMFWAMSFSLHYSNPFFCYLLVFGGLCVVCITGLLAFDSIRKKREASGGPIMAGTGTAYREPTWIIFLFVTCALAWVLGVVGGDINFFNNLEPYYDITNLATYPSVDPSRMRGQQLMDAGRIIFSEGSKLDLKMSMGFKNVDVFCVAPIVANSSEHITSYDFWAVGVNCCSGNRPDFHCGQFNNARASAGLRLMRDDQRAFFRLAVQQSEAANGIRANHPLFFHWMKDPIAEVNAYMDLGYKYYLSGCCAHFVLQLFLVFVASTAFAKMGRIA